MFLATEYIPYNAGYNQIGDGRVHIPTEAGANPSPRFQILLY